MPTYKLLIKDELMKFLKYLPLCLSTISLGVQAELLKKEEIELNFKNHLDFSQIDSLNNSLSIKDIQFCPVELESSLCLSSINKEKYVVDLEYKAVKKVVRSSDSTVVNLEYVYGVELELLNVFIENTNEGISNLKELEVSEIDVPDKPFEVAIENLPSKFRDDGLFDLMSVSSGGLYPNGCGTPDSASYRIIPDKPFLNACNEHDTCYASYTNKSKCDREFYNDMMHISRELSVDISLDFPVAQEVVLGALTSLAYVYFKAVDATDIALNAYCEGKGSACITEKGDYNVVNDFGSPIAGRGDGGDYTIFPRELYYGPGESCLMPVRYHICAYGNCRGYVDWVACP